MQKSNLTGMAMTCQMCEADSKRLYIVPAVRRLGERAPRVVCHFCFVRIVGIAPRRSALAVPSRPLQASD